MNISINDSFLLMLKSYQYITGNKTLVLLKASLETYPVEAIEKMGWNIVFIGPTLGALPTALLAIEHVTLEQPLIVVPGDSYVAGGYQDLIEEWKLTDSRACVATLEAKGPSWSYIRPGGDSRVLEIQEKHEISKLATTGMFAFRSGFDFLESAKWVFKNQFTTGGVYFVSSSIQAMIILGQIVTYSGISAANTYTYFGDRDGRKL